MKIKLIGEPKTIMKNPYSFHNYFAWPTVERLQNGKIAVTASGYRLSHVCPFGKLVISYSEDNGETYTQPAPIIDTPLDDRDGGICAFGEKNVIVTSFNNTRDFQRKRVYIDQPNTVTYRSAYLDMISDADEKKYFGSTFRISNDCGVTFGDLQFSPVTAPHGPTRLADGNLLYVGKLMEYQADKEARGVIGAYKMYSDGTTELLGMLENTEENGITNLDSEPYAIELPDGTIICHIRAEGVICKGGAEYVGTGYFTLFQSESYDGGKSWTKPHRILETDGGAPSHIIRHSSGMLIASYSYRKGPYRIKLMFSEDNGKTWDTKDNILFEQTNGMDMGYPSTTKLDDGTMLTVFYTRLKEGNCVIQQQKWTFEK